MIRLSRYSIYLRLLRISLVVGALYNGIFALLLLVRPGLPTSLLGLPQPGEAFYTSVIAVLLLGLAACYGYAFYDPDAYSGNIRIAIGARGLAGLLLLVHASGRAELAGLYALAGIDLFFAVAHAVFWWPVRR